MGVYIKGGIVMDNSLPIWYRGVQYSPELFDIQVVLGWKI